MAGLNGAGSPMTSRAAVRTVGSKATIKPAADKDAASSARTRNGARKNHHPAVDGVLAREFISVLIIGLANRLSRGASAYYRKTWNIGMPEWRVIVALRKTGNLNVGEVAEATDLDTAAVSRSLRLLESQKLVAIEQTRTRGRAAFARLTRKGKLLSARLEQVGHDRQDRLLAALEGDDQERLVELLTKLIERLPMSDQDP
jgi:DNA-binding MarR family transcriptional regulator